MKQHVAKIFIILAGILFLAHATIAHHHHDGEAVMVVNMLNSAATNHDMEHHKADGHSDAHDEECNMADASAAVKLFSSIQASDNQVPLPVLVALAAAFIMLGLFPALGKEPTLYYICHFHPQRLTPSHALRAPPVR